MFGRKHKAYHQMTKDGYIVREAKLMYEILASIIKGDWPKSQIKARDQSNSWNDSFLGRVCTPVHDIASVKVTICFMTCSTVKREQKRNIKTLFSTTNFSCIMSVAEDLLGVTVGHQPHRRFSVIYIKFVLRFKAFLSSIFIQCVALRNDIRI